MAQHCLGDRLLTIAIRHSPFVIRHISYGDATANVIRHSFLLYAAILLAGESKNQDFPLPMPDLN